MKPEVSVIAALSEGRVIGKDGQIPWQGKLPEDMKHFRDLTMGHPVIMGRRTWDSLPERFRPLPGRANIVLSTFAEFSPLNVGVADSMDMALKMAELVDRHTIFIVGGGQVYREALPLVDRLYLTIIKAQFEGDAYFPEYTEFKRVVEEEDGISEKSGIGYRFVTLERG